MCPKTQQIPFGPSVWRGEGAELDRGLAGVHRRVVGRVERAEIRGNKQERGEAKPRCKS